MIVQSDNFVLDDLGTCLVFVQGRANLDPEQHLQVGQTYRRLGSALPAYRMLVFTDGAGPTAQQRRELQAEFGPLLRQVRTAVVSDAVTVRFVVSMVAMFAANIRSFRVDDLPAALRFLDLDEGTVAKLRRFREIPPGRFHTFDAALRPLIPTG